MLTACIVSLMIAASPSTEAPSNKDTPARCDDEKDTCRDGCSMDFGTSVTLRERLVTCLVHCEERHDVCLLRIVAKRQVAAPLPGTSKSATPAEEAHALPASPYMLPPTRYTKAPAAQPPAPPPQAKDSRPKRAPTPGR